jgi:hypothetical protein
MAIGMSRRRGAHGAFPERRAERVEQVIGTILREREHYGIPYTVIAGEKRIESFAPVIARLTGK